MLPVHERAVPIQTADCYPTLRFGEYDESQRERMCSAKRLLAFNSGVGIGSPGAGMRGVGPQADELDFIDVSIFLNELVERITPVHSISTRQEFEPPCRTSCYWFRHHRRARG